MVSHLQIRQEQLRKQREEQLAAMQQQLQVRVIECSNRWSYCFFTRQFTALSVIPLYLVVFLVFKIMLNSDISSVFDCLVLLYSYWSCLLVLLCSLVSYSFTNFNCLITVDRVLRCWRTQYGLRGFSMFGPTAWNSVPTFVCDLSESSFFCRQLKTELFCRAWR